MDEELPRESTVVKSSVTFPNVSEKGKRERERGGEGTKKSGLVRIVATTDLRVK